MLGDTQLKKFRLNGAHPLLSILWRDLDETTKKVDL